MRRLIPYIVAALMGLFINTFLCSCAGFEASLTWRDGVSAFLACVMVWCWRGENGVWSDIKLMFGRREDSHDP